MLVKSVLHGKASTTMFASIGLLSSMYSHMNDEVSLGSGTEVAEFALEWPFVRVSHSVRDDELNPIAGVLTRLALIRRAIEVILHVFIVFPIPFAFKLAELAFVSLVFLVNTSQVLFESSG